MADEDDIQTAVAIAELTVEVRGMRTQVDALFTRFNSMGNVYLPRELYLANRESDRKDVKALRDDMERQTSSRWRWASTVIVPSLWGAVGAGVTLLIWLAERH